MMGCLRLAPSPKLRISEKLGLGQDCIPLGVLCGPADLMQSTRSHSFHNCRLDPVAGAS